MSWSFVAVVILVVLTPGVDLLMTLRNTVAGGRVVGAATAAGVGVASAAQGALVAVGVGAVVVRVHWLFLGLKWVGIAYLLFLGVRSLAAALRARGSDLSNAHGTGTGWTKGFRQGVLCNVTNPKMLVFYLSLLPQFVAADASLGVWLVHAWMMPLVGSIWLLAAILLAGSVRQRLLQPLVRRFIDGVAGVALIGFGARLATEH